MSGAFTLVFYYVPEDLDDLTIPNAFAVPKDINEITLNDIESFFPFKEKCLFRFQFKHGDQVVWLGKDLEFKIWYFWILRDNFELDLNKKNVKVPQYDGKIVMKVSRETKKGKYQNSRILILRIF